MLCSLGFHKWTKWSEPSKGELIKRNRITGEECYGGIGYRQTRSCEVCGKFEARIEKEEYQW